VFDDPDAVRENVCLLEVLRRQEDGHAILTREPADLVPQRGAALHVETGGRLVEEEDARTMHERHREIEAPLHAARVAAHLAVGGLRKPDTLEELVCPCATLGARDRLQCRLQAQMLAAGEQWIQRRLLQCSADARTHLRPLAHDVVACDARDARRRRKKRRKHQDSCGLPGAVRAEEAVDLT